MLAKQTSDFADSFPSVSTPVKASQPTMVEVLNPSPPEAISIVEPPPIPASIVGGGQEAQSLSNEMAIRQDALESSRGQSVGGGGNNVAVASDNSVNNYTDFTQVMPGPQPSTRDNTDEWSFMKSTGR